MRRAKRRAILFVLLTQGNFARDVLVVVLTKGNFDRDVRIILSLRRKSSQKMILFFVSEKPAVLGACSTRCQYGEKIGTS